MGYISEQMLCGECGHSGTELLDRDKRDEASQCPACESLAYHRTWAVPHVSTEKTSASIPDVVGAGRFDRERTKQTLKKEKARARSSGDKVSEQKINKEMRKL
jgi:hypothetical protein